MADPATDPWTAATEAAGSLTSELGGGPFAAAVILGSGWASAVSALGETLAETTVSGRLGFPAPSVAGHGAMVRAVDVAGRRVLVFVGRVHGYEGHPSGVVVHGVRTAVAAGAGVVILTNAAGSLRLEHGPGTPVLINDHLNLTGTSPLTGAEPPPPYRSRFVDLTAAYSPRLRALAHEVDTSLAEGVYAGLPGPTYETPAEIRMLRILGADLVGMSTVLEAIAARHAGAEVLGVSLVTNLAAGISPEPLDHAEVLAAGRAAGDRVAALLRGTLERF
jgi:purine-nucleoside phosphorylase